MAKVLVIYKSGAQLTIQCEEFSVKNRGGTLTEVEWKGAVPRPLHFGIDDVAAIFEVAE